MTDYARQNHYHDWRNNNRRTNKKIRANRSNTQTRGNEKMKIKTIPYLEEKVDSFEEPFFFGVLVILYVVSFPLWIIPITIAKIANIISKKEISAASKERIEYKKFYNYDEYKKATEEHDHLNCPICKKGRGEKNKRR